MNSRIITILGIVFSVIGLTIMADWQSIPYDPCTEYSLYHHPELARNYSSDSPPVAPVNQRRFEALSVQIVDNAVYKAAMNKCESFHNSEYDCHWIPNSEITKSFCDECQPICRSEHQTLNFVLVHSSTYWQYTYQGLLPWLWYQMCWPNNTRLGKTYSHVHTKCPPPTPPTPRKNK